MTRRLAHRISLAPRISVILKLFFPMLVALAAMALAGCGGSGGSSSSSGGGNTPPPVNNTQPIAVNAGPANNSANAAFTSVTVCNPGTATCTTVPDVLVDTGSTGLRILRSALNLTVTNSSDGSGNPLAACAQFVDGSFAWGSVAKADIQLAGEIASSVPIEVIADPSVPNIPTACSNGGANLNTVTALAANGILGVGLFAQDCGPGCAPGGVTPIPPVYFSCPSSGCVATTMALASQLQNPVHLFPQDNNGILLALPTVPASGAATLAGSMIFGIGTQSNNALTGVTVYTTDQVGNFSTIFNNQTFSKSFIDSGSNGIFFLDVASTGIPICAKPNASFYCPASTQNLTATNKGLNGNSAPVPFSIANADQLFTTHDSAFINLGGPNPGAFDWGLPFFYGRNVFVAIEGQSTSGGTGPFWAY